MTFYGQLLAIDGGNSDNGMERNGNFILSARMLHPQFSCRTYIIIDRGN